MEGIFESIITKNMATLAASVVAVMLVLGKVPLKNERKLNQTKFWKNWGVFILTGLCMVGSFMPGVNDMPLEEWGSIIVFALVTTIVAHLGRAVLKPLLFRKLEGKKSVGRSEKNEI